ncbi:hypothetical protein NIF40_11515 [[Clostridium] leptum]|uniref:Uncharacterized protein n=1 Tax=Solibaculum mannosilyticum TaxID=2780922 RepID=A0A7I8D2J6_9FIRM|nr:hypothetical protein [Solibaculum mannosilyticum]MCO7138151.1 hypothetical protein [[Clostridium] leptum]BCI61006.1 hypothetical protein C12CBH8_16450 [Solibaculum mannosilyticum]
MRWERDKWGSGKQQEYMRAEIEAYNQSVLHPKKQNQNYFEKNKKKQPGSSSKNGASKSLTFLGDFLGNKNSGIAALADFGGKSSGDGAGLAFTTFTFVESAICFTAAHWVNEDLQYSEKLLMTNYEKLAAGGGILLAYGMANIWNPMGWGTLVASTLIMTMYSLTTGELRNQLLDVIEYSKDPHAKMRKLLEG